MPQTRSDSLVALWSLAVACACVARADIALDQQALPLLKEVQTQVHNVDSNSNKVTVTVSNYWQAWFV